MPCGPLPKFGAEIRNGIYTGLLLLTIVPVIDFWPSLRAPKDLFHASLALGSPSQLPRPQSLGAYYGFRRLEPDRLCVIFSTLGTMYSLLTPSDGLHTRIHPFHPCIPSVSLHVVGFCSHRCTALAFTSQRIPHSFLRHFLSDSLLSMSTSWADAMQGMMDGSSS
jgi:hypothetical protein